jgi:hypothetical protein
MNWKKSRIQRITIKVCGNCNASYTDDEAYFRDVLAVAGEKPNKERQELWSASLRSFLEIDARRRFKDLSDLIRPVEVKGQTRHEVCPGEGERVLRVVKKVIRGLSHHHRIQTAVPESRIQVDVIEPPIPEDILSEMTCGDCDPNIVEYHYKNCAEVGMLSVCQEVFEELRIQSVWLITFYESVTFHGLVATPGGDFSQGVG